MRLPSASPGTLRRGQTWHGHDGAAGVVSEIGLAFARFFGSDADEGTDLIHVLNEVAGAVSSARSVDEIVATIVRRAKDITDSDKAILLLTEEHSRHLDLDTIVVRGRRLQHGEEWWGPMLDRLGERVFSAGQPCVERHPEFGAEVLACPLLVKDRPIGLLCAINALDRPFRRDHEDFMLVLSAFAASAIENARLAEESRYVLLASERDRIAREMHDGVVQSLFSISLGLELCKKQVLREPQQVADRLEELQEQVKLSMTELRRFIYDLRPMKLTELGVTGAIEYWIDQITQGRPVRGRLVVSEALPVLDPATEACLYRVAKEAVSNVVRHAGAGRFEVRIGTEGRMMRLEVEDDGVGFDSALVMGGGTPGMGLNSIRERVARAGGVLDVRSTAGRGSVIAVDLPLPEVT